MAALSRKRMVQSPCPAGRHSFGHAAGGIANCIPLSYFTFKHGPLHRPRDRSQNLRCHLQSDWPKCAPGGAGVERMTLKRRSKTTLLPGQRVGPHLSSHQSTIPVRTSPHSASTRHTLPRGSRPGSFAHSRVCSEACQPCGHLCALQAVATSRFELIVPRSLKPRTLTVT